MSEIWKDVFGWVGMYQVSNLGRVRSVDRVVSDVRNNRELKYKGKVLSSCATVGGYFQVIFSKDGVHTNKPVHRLVLETFVGECPHGCVSCHNDGNKSNNHLANLRWDTQSNNLLDKITHGTSDRGSANSQAKLTDSQVIDIRTRFASGTRGIGRRLAAEFGVSTSIISAIVVGKRWGWL